MLLYTPLARVLKAQCLVIPESYALKVCTHRNTPLHAHRIYWSRTLLSDGQSDRCSLKSSTKMGQRERSQSAEERARERRRAHQDKIERELIWRDMEMRVWAQQQLGKGGTSRQREKKGKGMRERSLFQASQRLQGLPTVSQDVRFRSLVKDLNILNHSETVD